MYTEENEFDYNDYLDEDTKPKKSLIDFKFLLRVFIIVILIILIIFLVFKIANRNKNKTVDKNINEVYKDGELVFIDDFSLMRDATRSYFFDQKNLPRNVGDSLSVNIRNLIASKLITSVKDEKGNVCNYDTSGAIIVKNKKDYKVVVNLNCDNNKGEETYYYDLDGKCLTCNGEKYDPNENIESEEVKPVEDSKDVNSDPVDKVPNNQTDKVPVEPVYVCNQTYSDWTSEYKEDSDYERESRVLVKGYKEDITYGDWSEPTTNKIEGSGNLEVKIYDKTVSSSSKKCSQESTTKPSKKSGRVITSRTVTKTTTKEVCTGGGTYTKKLTKWDNNAISCKSYGIGNVVCTYKSKKTCTNKKVNTYVTYYKYCDTITKNVTKTYYQARVINRNTLYTDYMLENELPEGYQILEGSSKTEYRYRLKCVK